MRTLTGAVGRLRRGIAEFAATAAHAGSAAFRIFLVLSCLVAALPTFADTGPLTARLVDHVSNVGLAGQDVYAYEKQVDGSLVYRVKRTTEGDGLAKFDLEGLGSGKVYVLKANPYGYWVSSAEIAQTGWYGFRVGKLQIQVVDGITGQARAGQTAYLKRGQADGSYVWAQTVTTDAQGWIRLDPVDLGQASYVLAATSPTDGEEKVSGVLLTGANQFTLGNAAVEIQLKDGVSGSGLSGQWVEAWEKLGNGSVLLRTKRKTDGQGLARFDLDGLQSRRQYQFKGQPYVHRVTSADVGASGRYDLKAGKLQVQVLDGRDGSAYAWSDVVLLEQQADGSLTWLEKLRTDASGQLKLDPAKLGERPYVLRATSRMDGSVKDSVGYATGGAYQFKVGGVGLTARLVDHVSNVGLAGQDVYAYEKQVDGSLVYRVKRTTEGDGLAKFDLEGLGSGKVYVLKANPYGYWVSSAEIAQTGWYGFRVGKLQIQVVDGITGQARAGQTAYLKRGQADGSYVWAQTVTTDAQGWIRLDPVDLGQASYVLAATSPTDGEEKVSGVLLTGANQFTLGNAAVEIQLKDGVSGSGLSGQWVEAWEKLGNGSVLLRTKRKTDGQGLARFDLDGLQSRRQYQFKGQPYVHRVTSADVGASGRYDLKAGKLQVQVLDGRDGSAYAWSDVVLLEQQADGSLTWLEKLRTDASGQLKLDPAKLGERPYVLRATSRMDGSVKDSVGYATGGAYQFKVGGVGLTARLVDHVSNVGLAGQDVYAYEKQVDGSLVYRVKRTTEGDGLAKFDLEGLGSGKVYVLKANPYGYWVSSAEIAQTGWYGFRVGTTELVLSNAPGGAVLAGQSVVAMEKPPNGSLRWERSAVTDTQGRIKFDLPGLGKGAVYVFKVVNPFADGKDYYSNLLSWLGAFNVALDAAHTNAPDRVPPQVTLAFPSQGAAVSRGGFHLYGSATDDVSVKSVKVYLTLPTGAVLERTATYRADEAIWYLDTGALGDAADLVAGPLGVRVVATDSGLNEAEAQVDLALTLDQTPPQLAVLSHADGASVPFGGFVVSGTLTDNTLSPTLSVRIAGGGLATAETRAVGVVPESGRWAVRVAPETAFSAQPISLTFTASDGAGNSTVRSLSLQPGDTYAQAWHVLQRLGYGATPGMLDAVVGTGVTNYLQAQLYPESVDDSGFVQHQQAWLDTGSYLATDYLRHGVYSRRQLLEIMTWFWDNHFNTYYYKHNNAEYERREMAGFRSHALGRFRDLLGVSAKSPAMLYTLDGVTNMVNSPNENYARELLELHTLGIDGGYTQQDVVEVARAFTGWSVVDGQFAFNAQQHDNGAKLVLGTTLAANGGPADGEAVLDMLAKQPATAGFICSKLVTLLVSDVPVDSLVQRCASVFLASADAPDQIAQVLSAILASPEFLGTGYRGAKVKTPLELALGLVRNLGGETGADDLAVELQRMGMSLFVNPMPTGYKETGRHWISTGMLLGRVRFADRVLCAGAVPDGTVFDLKGVMAAAGAETAEGVVGRILDLTLGPNWTRHQWDLGLSLLTVQGSKPYFAWLPDAEARLRGLAKALATLPEYQYQ